ncbi:hypothetical protein ACHAPU_011330 [Fusarium lateritium]
MELIPDVGTGDPDSTIHGVYHPPKGVYFRLRHVATNQCFYARSAQSPYTGCVWSSSKACQDQYFELVPYKLRWAMRNKKTGNYLTMKNLKDAWITQTTSVSDRCGLRLEKGKGKEGQFMIYFMNDGPYTGAMMANYDGAYTRQKNERNDGQYWEMLYEPGMAIDNIEYQTDAHEILNQGAQQLEVIDFTNKSSIAQESTFSYDKTVTHSSEFTHSMGVSIKIEVSGKVGIPFVSKGGIKVEVGTEYKYSVAKKETTEERYARELKVMVPPQSAMRVQATVKAGKLKVPFVITYVTESGVKLKSRGIWYGVTSWNTSVDYKEIELTAEDESIEGLENSEQ